MTKSSKTANKCMNRIGEERRSSPGYDAVGPNKNED
jgi:hypothetical protein